MPQVARQYSDYYYYGGDVRTCTAVPKKKFEGSRYSRNNRSVSYIRKRRSPKADKNRAIARFVGSILFLLMGVFILPAAFKNISVQMFIKTPYSEIQADVKQLLFPTVKYLNNNLFLGEYSLSGAYSAKKAGMADLLEGEPMTGLEKQIIDILPQFESIQPSVFVWDYNTGNYADINSESLYSAASIIKIPVLLSLFKTVEAKQVSLDDRMVLKTYYRAEGSGGLQYKAEDSTYSLDELARVMITDSDNSSTNMIMSKIGSMTAVNRQIRAWGLKHTSVHTWLPDLGGTNYTTARDLAKMLYNIENPDFLSPSSRSIILDYMGHVKNNRLIQAGLGQGATFIHKTGDIGKMLGDAGVVTMPNGRKYIIVVMVNRPYNSPLGKDFIVKTSEIVYQYMSAR